MIVIYDNITNKVLAGPFEEYKVDGKEAILEPQQVVLNVITNDAPNIDVETQYVNSTWVVENNNYILQHSIVNKTAVELEQDIERNVPEFITKKQFMLQLFESKNLGEVDILTWIKNSEITAKNKKRTEIEILYETKYYFNNNLLKNYLASIGLADRQAKIFYRQAIKL